MLDRFGRWSLLISLTVLGCSGDAAGLPPASDSGTAPPDSNVEKDSAIGDDSSSDTGTGADASAEDTLAADVAADSADPVDSADTLDAAETCVPAVPATEVCNNLDDDCDGKIDEDVTASCYTGPADKAGIGACKAGVKTCSAGAFGACAGEVLPSAETCNGVDDDCNALVDTGCPASVTFKFVGYTPYHGGAPATGIMGCPAGQAIAGFNATVGASPFQWLTSISIACSPVAVTSVGAAPYSYTVRATSTPTGIAAVCPAGTFATAISGAAATNIDRLQLHCSTLTLAGTPGAFTASRVTIGPSAMVGGPGGTAFGPDGCVGADVGISLNVRLVSGAVSGLQLGCATPQIAYKP